MAQADLFNDLGMTLDPETQKMIADMEAMANEQQGDVIGSALEEDPAGAYEGPEGYEEEPTTDAAGTTTYGSGARSTDRPGQNAPVPSSAGSPDVRVPAAAAPLGTVVAGGPDDPDAGGPLGAGGAEATPTMSDVPMPVTAESQAPQFSSQLKSFAGGGRGGAALSGVAGGLLGGGLGGAEAGAGTEEDPSSLLLSLMQLLGQGQ